MLLVRATLGARCAFLMPVGTPPDAIVFGSGPVRMRQMRDALWLDLAGILIILTLAWYGLPSLLAFMRRA